MLQDQSPQLPAAFEEELHHANQEEKRVEALLERQVLDTDPSRLSIGHVRDSVSIASLLSHILRHNKNWSCSRLSLDC